MQPWITVTIGRESRVYFAYVTTAPPALDSPATVTLYEGPLSDVVGPAADPITCGEFRGRTPARLVLVEAIQHAWQQANYLGHHHLLLPADPGLASLDKLQDRLWRRLQARDASLVAA